MFNSKECLIDLIGSFIFDGNWHFSAPNVVEGKKEVKHAQNSAAATAAPSSRNCTCNSDFHYRLNFDTRFEYAVDNEMNCPAL